MWTFAHVYDLIVYSMFSKLLTITVHIFPLLPEKMCHVANIWTWHYLSITIGTFSIKNILATKIFTAFNTLKRVPRIDNTHIKHIPTLLQLFQQITELLWPITTLLRHITVTLHHQTYVTNEMTLLSVMKLCKFHNDFIFRWGYPTSITRFRRSRSCRRRG